MDRKTSKDKPMSVVFLFLGRLSFSSAENGIALIHYSAKKFCVRRYFDEFCGRAT